jgi:hypothetical protein
MRTEGSFRWRCSAGLTGPRTITTSHRSTQDGTLVAQRRIGDDAAGFAVLLQLLVEAGDDPDIPIPVAIETSRGLLVACLRATGCPVFPIKPALPDLECEVAGVQECPDPVVDQVAEPQSVAA